MIIKIPDDSTELVTELIEKLGGSVEAEKKTEEQKTKRWAWSFIRKMERLWYRREKNKRRIMEKGLKVIVDTAYLLKRTKAMIKKFWIFIH